MDNILKAKISYYLESYFKTQDRKEENFYRDLILDLIGQYKRERK